MNKFITGIVLFFAINSSFAQIKTTTNWKNKQQEILYKLYHPSKNHVLAVAHRGAWSQAPENSLLAIQRCIDMGVDIAEIDVRLTKDSQLVVIHDLTLDRTTTGKGKVADYTLAELKKFRLKNAVGIPWSTKQQIPTLEEAMLLAKGKIMINLDKTEAATLRQAYEVLKKTGTIDHGIFKGNDSVQVMRQKFGTLMDSIIYMPKVWYSLPNISSYVTKFNEDVKPAVYEMLFDNTASPVFGIIKEMNINKISVLAIALWDNLCAGHSDEMASTKGAEKAYGWLIANGANAIMTDHPEALLVYLRKKKLHN
jgi:glycerophosphoryl diester phosphodiesterase